MKDLRAPLATIPRSRAERLALQCCPAVTPASLDDRRAADAAARFKALADPTRLQMLALLAANGEGVCVCDINDGFALGQPTISHHLRVLRDAGLVSAERRRNWAYYSLHPAAEGWVRQTLASLPGE